MNNKLTFMKIHTLLAVFLLPVALMFFITGGLYIWGVKGVEKKSNYTITIDKTFIGNIDSFVNITKDKLIKLNLPFPTGEYKIKNEDNRYVFEWKGSSIEVKINTNKKTLISKMEIKESNWYRHLVQLHKDKGGFIFKIYATILSVALLIVLITGFIMAWRTPKLKSMTILSTIIGMALFLILVITN